MKLICEGNGYFITDNSNIETRELWKDGIHLLESRKTKLAENFIYIYQTILADYLVTIIFQKVTHTKMLNPHTLNYQTQKVASQSQLKAF